jgi:anti-sigma factor RsiW
VDHDAFRRLAAGAALGDLEPSERTALDAHVDGCARCRREAAEVAAIAALVRSSARQAAALHRPRPALWDSIRAAIATPDA